MKGADYLRLSIEIDALKIDLDELIQLEKERRRRAGQQQPGDFNSHARLLWKPNTERKEA